MEKMAKKICVLLGDTKLPDPVKHRGKFNPEDFNVIERLKNALSLLNSYEFDYLSDHETLEEKVKKVAETGVYDYFFNLCDEGFQNRPEMEAYIPMLLERHNLLYTGAASRCLEICYDKHAVKEIAKSAEIPVSNDVLIDEKENKKIKNLPFSFPAFIKPNYGDGSFAIDKNSLVYDTKQLENQVNRIREKLRKFREKADILVEEYLPGGEISAAIIGNGDKLDIRLLQENFGGNTKFSSSDTKWDPKSDGWNLTSSGAPTISNKIKEEIIRYSKYLFRGLECRDYARFDFRMNDKGRACFLEANPNCGWCWDGHLVKAFLLGEYHLDLFSLEGYSSVLEKILKTAEERFDIEKR